MRDYAKLFRMLPRFGALCAFVVFSSTALAALSEEELAKLGWEGTPLTPMGAIREGNEEGTIPAWSTEPVPTPPSYEPGGEHQFDDPYKDEERLFTITAENYREYEEHLTPGQVAMFQQYPESYRMHVYPTKRYRIYPKWVYDRTLEQAAVAELAPSQLETGRVGLANYKQGGGVPFPIPKNGDEAAWSQFVAYRSVASESNGVAPLMDARGNRTDVIVYLRDFQPWWVPNDQLPDQALFHRDGGAIMCDSQGILQPARQAGFVFGGCNAVNDFNFNIYLYIPGQRRVRRAPEIGLHDSPSFGSDGQRTVSSRWMFWIGGKDSSYDIELRGRTEKFVAANSYPLAEAESFDDLFGPNHINQDLVRYELRRVWHITARLKPGERNLYQRHDAYFDEDTWKGVAQEAYDAEGRLWRVGEQFNLYNHDIKAEVIYGDYLVDLLNGRYTTFPYWYMQAGHATGFGPPKFAGNIEEVPFDLRVFTPAGLRRQGMR